MVNNNLLSITARSPHLMHGTEGAALWVVSDSEAQQALESVGFGSFALNESELNNWTLAKGPGEWSEWRLLLRDKRVYISLPTYASTSEKARKGIKAIVSALEAVGAEVTVLSLPKGDSFVEAWRDAGGLKQLVDMASRKGESPSAPGLIQIPSTTPVAEQLRQIGDILEEKNGPEHLVSLPNGKLGQIKKVRDKWTASEYEWEAVASTLSAWLVEVDITEKAVNQKSSISSKTVSAFMQMPPWRGVPDVLQIAAPPLVRPDWSFYWGEGYDAESSLWSTSEMLEPEWSERKITRAEMEAARTRTLGWFREFPFAHPGSKADCLALALTPWFIRQNPTAYVPGGIIIATQEGSGKTQTAQMIGMFSTGQKVKAEALPEEETELEKRVFSKLRTGSTTVQLWDNIKHKIDSPTFETLLTGRELGGRLLGKSDDSVVRNDTLWLMTANNTAMSNDMLRRTVLIELDKNAGSEVPWTDTILTRAGMFSELIREDLALLVTWWVQQGMEEGSVSWQNYSSWSQTMSGILDAIGVEGFLATQDDIKQHVGSDNDEYDEIISRIYKIMGRVEWTASELWDASAGDPTGAYLDPDKNFVASWLTKGDTKKGIGAGRKVSKLIGRGTHAGLTFERTNAKQSTKTATYRVVVPSKVE